MNNTTMTTTPEGKQLAADLANAAGKDIGGYTNWKADSFSPGSSSEVALARLATEHLALKAQLEEALADLREIDALLENAPDSPSVIADAKGLAAKWRVETDPLVEAIEALKDGRAGGTSESYAQCLRAELSKRGYEIGGKS